MKKFSKKMLACVIMTLVLVGGISSLAFATTRAAASEDIAANDAEMAGQPRYTYISAVGVTGDIDRNDGLLTFAVTVDTYEKCDIYVSTQVQQLKNGSWTTIKTFRNPSTGKYRGTGYMYENTYYVDASASYRLVTTADVTSVSSGYSEQGKATLSNVPKY